MDEAGGGRKRGGLFDDLAGVAGGAFSALAGVRGEAEALARTQIDAMVQRLDLVKREDLDAAMELARRAREAQEGLEARIAALESRLAALEPRAATPAGMASGSPASGGMGEAGAAPAAEAGTPTPGTTAGGTIPEGTTGGGTH
jgi:BMFP domain-containing protein YqiC